jgi:PAS domain S-box-containing protein
MPFCSAEFSWGVFPGRDGKKIYRERSSGQRGKVRNLVENMLDLVWQTDDNGKIIYVSPNIIDLLGYQPEEIIGQLFAQLLASEDRSNLDQEVAKAIQNQYNIRGISINLLHKNGYPVAFEMNATPLFDSEQECIGFVGIGRDITLRRQMEAEQIKIQKLESLGVWQVEFPMILIIF